MRRSVRFGKIKTQAPVVRVGQAFFGSAFLETCKEFRFVNFKHGNLDMSIA
jgi:hypothetical protein